MSDLGFQPTRGAAGDRLAETKRGRRVRALGGCSWSCCWARRSRTAPTSRPYFLHSTNLFFICLNVGEVAIMALPLTLLVVTGEIDLSVASTLGLSGVAHGGALQARLADLAGDDRGRRASARSSAR